MLKVLYGCCFKAVLNDFGFFDITYIDIIPGLTKPNGKYICMDIYDVNFNDYDIIIITPPCNYYSRCNYRRDISPYALATKNILPYCVKKCNELNKPFIIENVRSPKLFEKAGLFNYMYYCHGRHTYWTNILFNPFIVKQTYDFKGHGIRLRYNDNSQNYSCKNSNEGGSNVNSVFEEFLKVFIC